MTDKIQPRLLDFRGGLNTSIPDDAHDPAWRVLQDVRLDQGTARRRPGCVRLYRVAHQGTLMDFDGTNDFVTVNYDSRVWDLDTMATWTLEGLVNADTLASQVSILARSSATPDIKVYQDSTSSGRIVAELRDTGGNVLTLSVTALAAGVTIAWKLRKTSATGFTLTANGTSASGTLTAAALADKTDAILIGKDNGGNFYNGAIEFIRLFTGSRTTTMDAYTRLWLPRATSVLADYVLEDTDIARDRSRFGLGGAVSGSPTTRAVIAINPEPIQAISNCIGGDGTRTNYVISGGRARTLTT